MHQMTKEAIQKMQTQLNHVLTVEDFDLIGELDDAAALVAGITTGKERSIVFPIEVGGATLYPLTIAKSELAARMDMDIPEFIYMLSRQNDAPSFPRSDALRRDARKFYGKLKCTEAELSNAFNRVVAFSGGDSDGESKSDWPLLVDLLCSEYGSTPEYWVYHESIDLIKTLIDRIVERKSNQQSESEKGKAPAPTMKIKYLHDFREKCKEIKSIWSKTDG